VGVFVNTLLQNYTRHSKTLSGSILDLIGDTPLLNLNATSPSAGGMILAKAEFLNPSGSIKDRMVAYAIESAERRGELPPEGVVVEASSGNTGVSLAMVAAVKGYRAVIIVPDTTSRVKVSMMRRFGAEIIKIPADYGMKAVVEAANRVVDERDGFLLDQFKNPDNAKAHFQTGREILNQVKYVDAFVAGVGTGGTLVGVAQVLKKANPDTKIVAMEPATAPAFYNMHHGTGLPIGSGIPHKIEGIGETFVPELLYRNRELVDDVVLVSDGDAASSTRVLAEREGLIVGVSSGANVKASIEITELLPQDARVVTVLPDSGQRYF